MQMKIVTPIFLAGKDVGCRTHSREMTNVSSKKGLTVSTSFYLVNRLPDTFTLAILGKKSWDWRRAQNPMKSSTGMFRTMFSRALFRIVIPNILLSGEFVRKASLSSARDEGGIGGA